MIVIVSPDNNVVYVNCDNYNIVLTLLFIGGRTLYIKVLYTFLDSF